MRAAPVRALENGNGSRWRQLDCEARGEGLVRDARALDAVESVAAVSVLVEVVGVEDDIAFERAAQGVGFDPSGRVLVEEIDAKPVGSGETDAIQMGLHGPPDLKRDCGADREDTCTDDCLARDAEIRGRRTRCRSAREPAKKGRQFVPKGFERGKHSQLVREHLSPAALEEVP